MRRNFLFICLLIGVVLILSSAFVFVLPSLEPDVSTVNPNYSGLGIFVNKTNIIPTIFEIIVTAEPNTLYFQYFFSCKSAGTYNFLFVFPFNITKRISSLPDSLQFNSTSSSGSAVWMNFYSNGTSGSVSGEFEIADTFKSGSSGSYDFVLPFGFGLNEQDVEYLVSQLNVTFAQRADTQLIFTAPSPKYDILQTFPERISGWETMPGRPVDWTNRAGGEWDFSGGLQNNVIIYSRNNDEVRSDQIYLFLGGIILSIGIQVTLGAVYDFSKERFGYTRARGNTSFARLYPSTNQIWAKCPTCHKQNRIMKDFAELHPTESVPFNTKCFNCHESITILKCVKAPKTWETPTA